MAPSVSPESAGSAGRVTYPKLYKGAVLDLLNSDGVFLGKAMLRTFSVYELDLVRLEGMLSLPPVSPDDVVNVRGCAENGESFMLQTHVAQSSRLNIRLRDLALVSDKNQRNSPRFFVNRPAELSDPADLKSAPDVCTLVDISMEGACVRSAREYACDDVRKLRVELYPNAGRISFLSQVIRVVSMPDGQFEYGLLFEALPVAKRRYLAEDLRHLAGR